MAYIGLQSQITNNNIKTILLLTLFPFLVLVLVYAFLYIAIGYSDQEKGLEYINLMFIKAAPYAILIIGVWFIVAFFFNTHIIQHSTNSHSLERKDNKRVYNLVENLCMSAGMSMPQINIIYDDSLNAFASGINQKTYTITLSQGIINKLEDEELEAVIAHELTHIRNKDVRLLIVTIVFVGIFSFLMGFTFNILKRSGGRRSGKDKGSGLIIILIVLALAAIGYFFSTLFRFAISRNREFMADAGAAEMTKRPWALANALKKISQDSCIEAVTRKDVAQLFIEHPVKGSKKKGMHIFNLFATHPPIERRIEILEQF